MKSFYSRAEEARSEEPAPPEIRSGHNDDPLCSPMRGRIAVYDGPSAAPRVVDVDPDSPGEFIEALSSRVHELCRLEGGDVPYTVIREITENFIHADFLEPVVSILDSGSTIRFADQGPGFTDKERALAPGFTTAKGEMKRYIRGVGSGLPIVQEYLVHSGGYLAVDDNLGSGSVVTVHAGSREQHVVVPHPGSPGSAETPESDDSGVPRVDPLPAPDTTVHAEPRLSVRQQQVLALVLEAGLAGPSLVSRELGVGISTAYRDLATLEDAGLIVSDSGKRALTPDGLSFLGSLSAHS